jgi:WD40 repeat protein
MNDAIISTALSKLDKGGYLLINSSKATPVLNLFNLSTKLIERKFFGHRQECFSIKCSFGGEDENFLVCGSEEAKIYVWNRYHSIPILSIKVHSAPVNTVIFPTNANLSNLIISCSDDHTIKILSTDLINKAYFDDPLKMLSQFSFLPSDKLMCEQPNMENSNNLQHSSSNNVEEDVEESHYNSDSD